MFAAVLCQILHSSVLLNDYVQHIRQLLNAVGWERFPRLHCSFSLFVKLSSHSLNLFNSMSTFLYLGFPNVYVRHVLPLDIQGARRDCRFCILLRACFLNTVLILLYS